MCDLAELLWLGEVEREFLAVLQGRIARGEGGPDLSNWSATKAKFFERLAAEPERAGKGLDPDEMELRRALRVA